MKQLVALALGVIVALAVVACGDDEKKTSEEAQPATGAAETVTVRETEFALDPANPRVDAPGQVEFRVENDGKAVHALEIEGPGGESKTDDIQPGGSATFTANLDKPGSYEWYCPVGNHRDLGMEGEITVGGGTTQTGTTETGTTETEPGEDTGGSGSGGSGSGGSGGAGGY